MPVTKQEQEWVDAPTDPNERYVYTVSYMGRDDEFSDKAAAWAAYKRDRGPELRPAPTMRRSDGAVWRSPVGVTRCDQDGPGSLNRPRWMIPAPKPEAPPMPENF